MTAATGIDLSCAEWRKRSYSSQSGNCVEVGRNLAALAAVRDSKEPYGARLVLSREACRSLSGRYGHSGPFHRSVEAMSWLGQAPGRDRTGMTSGLWSPGGTLHRRAIAHK
jgi:hypothetical protein